MAEADNAANDRGKVSNFIVTGVERNSLRIDQLFKDEEAELEGLIVTDTVTYLGPVNIHQTIAWYKFAEKKPGAMEYNQQEGAATDIDGGWQGLLTALSEKFSEVYPDDAPYKHWANPSKWEARGAIQEFLTLLNSGQYATQNWHFNNGQPVPHLKLWNAGHLLFTSVLPHATGMSFCLINYMKANEWDQNRGFYTSMATMKDYYPLNFKAEGDAGWNPKFNGDFLGFQMQYSYSAEKEQYDEGGEPLGKKPVLCGDWRLPFHMWNMNTDVKEYPVLQESLTQANFAEHPPKDVKVTANYMKTQKYDFAGNIKYKLTKVEVSKESYDGKHDIFVMGEANKEIIVAGSFREGIMIVNFATKEYPKDQGRRPQLNKANAYRVKQFFGSMIEKGFLTTYGGDATVGMFKA